VRVLLAFEEEYRVYGQALADAIRTFRSYVQVAVTDTGGLEAQAERFDHQLVICSSPIPSNPVYPKLIASIELSSEPDQASRFRLGGRRWESTNPTLGEILSVVDETNWLLYRASLDRETMDRDEEKVS
jgi:hypothetical protein